MEIYPVLKGLVEKEVEMQNCRGGEWCESWRMPLEARGAATALIGLQGGDHGGYGSRSCAGQPNNFRITGHNLP